MGKQYSFNTANVYAITSTGAPIELMSVQDISLEFSRDTKTLTGTKAFAEIVALGKGKISGKGTIATYDANAIKTLGNMGAVTTGQRLYIQEPATLATGTPSVTTANSTNFYQDLGVKDVTLSTDVKAMEKVAATPATMQYAIDGTTKGKYLFNSADATAAKKVLISYIYESATGGSIIALTNPDMAAATFISMFLQGSLINKQNVKKQINVWLNCCLSSKLGFGWKLEDFNNPSFDFEAFADDIDSLGWMSIAN